MMLVVLYLLSSAVLPSVMVWWAVTAGRAARTARACARKAEAEAARWTAARDALVAALGKGAA